MTIGARTMRGLIALAATALTLGLTACGDDDDDAAGGRAEPADTAETEPGTPIPEEEEAGGGGGGGGGLQLSAGEDGGLKFEPASLTASAGEVTITMDNPDGNSMPHNVALEGDGVNETGEVVQPGGTSEVTATVEAGTYTYYCSVGAHRQNGMEGTLTVE
jgi:plastocyanin